MAWKALLAVIDTHYRRLSYVVLLRADIGVCLWASVLSMPGHEDVGS
jgi:hypothetical protein